MKLKSSAWVVAALIVCISPVLGQAPADDWMRVQSNDGEFSIEVPTKHSFFMDDKGFSVTKNSGDQDVRNMFMLTAFYRETLMSFEAYDGGKRAFDALYDVDAYAKEGRRTSERKNGKTSVIEVTNTTKTHFAIREFIRTKDHIYVVTAATRTGESAEMRRFLDSLKINDGAPALQDGATPFSRLKVDIPKIVFDDKATNSPSSNTSKQIPKPSDDPSIKPSVTVRAARPSYVADARDLKVRGTIRIKLRVEPDASISEIVVLTSLPGGLLKQAVFAAMRAKFIPKEKDDVPVFTYRTLEFSFDIY